MEIRTQKRVLKAKAVNGAAPCLLSIFWLLSVRHYSKIAVGFGRWSIIIISVIVSFIQEFIVLSVSIVCLDNVYSNNQKTTIEQQPKEKTLSLTQSSSA